MRSVHKLCFFLGPYLLSNDLRFVTGFGLERAVVRPEVDRVCDAGHAALVDEFGSLSACYREFEVGVLLPITEEQREFGEESIVDIAHRGDGLRTRVSVDATFEALTSLDQFLPYFVIV